MPAFVDSQISRHGHAQGESVSPQCEDLEMQAFGKDEEDEEDEDDDQSNVKVEVVTGAEAVAEVEGVHVHVQDVHVEDGDGRVGAEELHGRPAMVA